MFGGCSSVWHDWCGVGHSSDRHVHCSFIRLVRLCAVLWLLEPRLTRLCMLIYGWLAFMTSTVVLLRHIVDENGWHGGIIDSLTEAKCVTSVPIASSGTLENFWCRTVIF